MIRCGRSTPQTVTLTGTGFVDTPIVLVTPPDSTTPIPVTPVAASATVIIFAFVFAACGDYTIVVADATGQCDTCQSDPLILTPVPLTAAELAPAQTLGELRRATMHRLGDDDGTLWPADEVDGYLLEGYLFIATQLPVFWDQLYPEGGTSATVELPRTLTTLDRATWDGAWLEAIEPRSYSRLDARYKTTTGPVVAYMWQIDGVRTFRQVRVPAAAAASVTVTGTWGALRTPADLGALTITGTWGVPRILPGHHPLGPDQWGAPRRVYLEGQNLRVEHFRQGRALVTDDTICELPARYAIYLRDYAQAQCLGRPGPGYDQALSDHFQQRWDRGLARIARRLVLVDMEHVTVLGGDGRPLTARPPRPSLPWAYGARVR